jgi:MFS family permease
MKSKMGEIETDLESSREITLTEHENPLNRSPAKKWFLSTIVTMSSGTMGYYSGVHAASITKIAEYYHTSQLASTAAVSFFLLGFATGPLIFAPLSEMWGRNPIIRVTLVLFVISNIGIALAPNIETLLTFRFLGGLLGAPTGGKTYLTLLVFIY